MRQKKFTKLFQSARKLALLLVLAFVGIGFSLNAQISGTIVDESNVPMPGVNVTIKGTTVGTVTDINGKYSIKASEGDILDFSFVGYKLQEVTVAKENTINISLSEEKKELDEIVVIGYGVQKKSDLTGAVSSVSAKDIAAAPASNIVSALQGHAAGVQISQNTGAPGSDVTVRIRGVTSVNNLPVLWVVDGVPADPKSVDPNDIESMEVLKDASTAAIYGAQGASGVIIVTTKKGTAGKVDVTFNCYTGWQNIPKYFDVASGRQYASTMNEIKAYSNMTAKKPSALPFSNLDTIPNYDYQKLITTANAPMQSYELGVAGGSEKTKAYAGVSYLSQDGIVQATNYKKMTFRMNAESNAQKWLKIGEEASFIYQDYEGFPQWKLQSEYSSPILQAVQYQPSIAPYDTSQHLGSGYATPKGGGNWSHMAYGNIENPVAAVQLEQGNEINKTWGGGLTGHITIEPIKGLTFESRINGSFSFNDFSDFVPKYQITASLGTPTNSYNESWNISHGWLWQNIATYTKSFLDSHNFSIMGGYESSYSKYNEGINTTVLGIPSSLDMRYLGTTNSASTMGAYPTGTALEATGYSEFGRFNYDYKGIYLLQFNVRHDGSSNFGPNMRFGTFPSFSAGWKFSEEDFIKNLNIFSFGKLRIGYGSVGNSAINPYSYYSNVTQLATAGYDFGGTTAQTNGATVNALANPSVHWEGVVTQDAGLDMSFMKNRLSVSLDYFQRYNNGMLIQSPTQGYDGYLVRDNFNENGGVDPTPYVNVGKLKNSGLEITADWKDQVGDFKYDIGGNVTFVSSKAVSLTYDSIFSSASTSKGINGFLSYTEVGQPVGEFYGYKVQRIFTSADVDTTGNNKYVTNQPYTTNAAGQKVYAQKALPGDFQYKDINGDGKVNNGDIVPLGNPMPKFMYSLNMSFEYKIIDVQLFWQGTSGNKIFNTTKFYQANSNGAFNWSSAYVNNHYRDAIKDKSGNLLYAANTTGATYPGLNQTYSLATISDFYIEDGSYLRLKNVQIGVTLPKNWLSWINVSSFRIYVGGSNLLTFTKYSGIDPEVDVSNPMAAGIDKGAYPQAKVYTMGVNVRF